jgi:hypothetical protein
MRWTGCKILSRGSARGVSGCVDEELVYREEMHDDREDICLCRR